jgi:hypothetical protein
MSDVRNVAGCSVYFAVKTRVKSAQTSESCTGRRFSTMLPQAKFGAAKTLFSSQQSASVKQRADWNCAFTLPF